jgi:hypothetical protein
MARHNKPTITLVSCAADFRSWRWKWYFFRNVGSYANYIPLYSRRWQLSMSLSFICDRTGKRMIHRSTLGPKTAFSPIFDYKRGRREKFWFLLCYLYAFLLLKMIYSHSYCEHTQSFDASMSLAVAFITSKLMLSILLIWVRFKLNFDFSVR